MRTKQGSIQEKKNNSLILAWNIAFWYQAIKYFFILVGAENYLAIILRLIVLITIVLYFYGITYRHKIYVHYKVSAIIPFAVGLVLIATILFDTSNEYVQNYSTNYFQYMFIPLLALVAIDRDSYRNFIIIYFDLALFFFVTLGLSPFIHPDLFTNDMAYGFAITLPCGIAFYIGRHYLNRKWILPFEIICYVLGIVSSTRSTILSFIFMIVVCNLILHKTTLKRAMLYLGGIITAFFVYFNLLNIFTYLIDFLGTTFNYHSRSLSFLYMGITGDTSLTGGYSNFSSGRDIILRNAIDVFKSNCLTGIGIGGFERSFGFYSHNILADFALDWGIIGIIIFASIMIYSIRTMLKVEKGDFSPRTGLLLLLLCLWCPKLFFSTSFINDLGFWSFIIFCIKINRDNHSIVGEKVVEQL